MVLGAAHLNLLCCHPPQIPISDLKNNLNENNEFNNFSFNDFNKKILLNEILSIHKILLILKILKRIILI